MLSPYCLLYGSCTASHGTHLRVNFVMKGRQIISQDPDLLPRPGAEEWGHDAEGEAKPRRRVDHKSLVAALNVVQSRQLCCALDVLLDLSCQRLRHQQNEERYCVGGKKNVRIILLCIRSCFFVSAGRLQIPEIQKKPQRYGPSEGFTARTSA